MLTQGGSKKGDFKKEHCICPPCLDRDKVSILLTFRSFPLHQRLEG